MSDFWELQRMGFRAAAGALKLGGKAVTGAARAGQLSADRANQRRARSLAGGGVLGPGDPPAPPGSEVLDYRGTAPLHSLRLARSGLPIGALVDPRRGPIGPAFLPINSILRHACVIGPSGSGKTFSLIVPWIVTLLQAGVSVATVDVKGDLLDEIRQYTQALGAPTGAQGLVWDFARPGTHRWNFLREVRSDRGVEAVVLSLLGKAKENDSQPFFYQRDYRWLKGLVRLVMEIHGAAAEPRHLLESLTDPDQLRALAPYSTARNELYDLAALDDADFGRDVSGLMNALSLFGEAEIIRSVAVSDFQLDQVLARPTLLIGVARLSDARRAEQMSSLLLSQLSLTVLERFGAGPTQPLAFVIDEAPRLKDRLDLEALLSVARGAGVGVVLAAQDVSQFGTVEQQSALLANCHIYVSMFGVSPASTDYLGKRLGTRMKEQLTYSQNAICQVK